MSGPLRRFLGLPEQATDAEILGLKASARRLRAADVDAALAERLARLSRHPDSDSAAAAAVRQRLLDAASRLRPPPLPQRRDASPLPTEADGRGDAVGSDGAARPAMRRPTAGGAVDRSASIAPSGVRSEPLDPRRSPGPLRPIGSAIQQVRPRVTLTPFDRAVLALLVASGGWNARSRSLLVAMATARGVSPQGLVRIVRGLADHVRAGDSRPGPTELSGSLQGIPLRAPPEPTRLERMVDQIEEVVVEELRSDRFASRFRLTVVFSILTLVSGALLLRLLLTPSEAPPSRESIVATDVPVQQDAAEATSPAVKDEPAAPAIRPLANAGRGQLRGDRRPAEALRTVERAAGLPLEFAEIGRRAALSTDRLPEAVRQRWVAALADSGTAWVLLDPVQRGDIIDEVLETIRYAATPSIAETLMDAMAPRTMSSDPLDLWRQAFLVGTLGEILRSSALFAPAMAIRAARHLEGWTGVILPATDAGFSTAAGLRLDRAGAELVAATVDSPVVAEAATTRHLADRWEAWFEAQRVLRPDARLQSAFLEIVEALLRSGRDLAAPGPVSGLLARLVEMLRADLTAVRDAVLAWYVDEAISSDAMWVFTSMLHAQRKPPELATAMLVDWNMPIAERRRRAESLAAAWVESTVERVAVTPRWLEVTEDSRLRWITSRTIVELVAQDAIASGDREAQVEAILLASMLNEAVACLVVGDERGAAERLAIVSDLRSSDESTLRRSPLRRLGSPVGSPRANDGAFAEGFRGDRDIEARLSRLAALRSERVTDLGPEDAVEFVRAALRGTQPPEVRSAARSLLADQFAYGRTVLRVTLDMLPDAVVNDELAEVIAQVVGRQLPPVRSSAWMIEARRALLEHVIMLHDDELSRVDLYAANIAESVRQRLELASPGAGVAFGAERQPQVVMEHLVDAWRDRAAATLSARPLVDLHTLDRRRALRRRLADSGIARFVAEQATLLDLAAHVVVSETPALRSRIESLLIDATERRQASTTALIQAVETELALTRLWLVAIDGESTVVDPADLPASRQPTPRDPLGEDPSTEGTSDPGRSREDLRPPTARPPERSPVRPPDHELPTSRPGRGMRLRRGRVPGSIVSPRRGAQRGPQRSAWTGSWTRVLLPCAVVAALAITALGRTTAATDAGAQPRWAERLAALRPSDPEAYFMLAEEVADAAATPADRELASQLFRLAGALAPEHLGRSACLALADLAETRGERIHFRAAATLLDRRNAMPLLGSVDEPSVVDPAAAMALSEALGHLRLGQGQQATRLLRRPGVRELLSSSDTRALGGPERIETDAAANRSGQRVPIVDPRSLLMQLRIELGLMAGSARPWSSDLVMEGRPLTEVDPERIEDFLGVDVRRSVWRDGRWREPVADERRR